MYLQALHDNHRLTRAEGIDAVLEKHKLDALVAPSNGPAWTTDLVNGDRYLGSSSSFAAVAGYPNLTVPAGYVDGLPVGMSLFSTAYREGGFAQVRLRLRAGDENAAAPAVFAESRRLNWSMTLPEFKDSLTRQTMPEHLSPRPASFVGRRRG